MKKITLSLALVLLPLQLLATETLVKIATYDSGFGGFFTAKAIEQEARKLSEEYNAKFIITHYGDTANAPYGEKTADQIANLSAKGISRAFQDGAEEVFIACNTASTQFEGIKNLLNKEKNENRRIVSIIESSVAELKNHIDKRLQNKAIVRVALLATPFTVKNMIYPKALAKAYGVQGPIANISSETIPRWYKEKGQKIDNLSSYNELVLPSGKKIEVYQLGPGNWVDMIEHGADSEVQLKAIQADLKILNPAGSFDVVGEFCTHFPVFDSMIKKTALEMKITDPKTAFIQQGPLMAGIFKEMMIARLSQKKRKEILSNLQKEELHKNSRPVIYLSGKNLEETEKLSKTVFPADPVPTIKQKDF